MARGAGILPAGVSVTTGVLIRIAGRMLATLLLQVFRI